MIDRDPAECATTFLDVGHQDEAPRPSFVSRKAAETCLKKSNAPYIQALNEMFGVDPDAMALLSSGAHGTQADQQGPIAVTPNTWSTKARKAAGQKAYENYHKIIKGVRDIEDGSWGAKKLDGQTRSGSMGYKAGRTVFDEWQGEGAREDAEKDPSRVRQPMDIEDRGNGQYRDINGNNVDRDGNNVPEPKPEPDPVPERDPDPPNEEPSREAPEPPPDRFDPDELDTGALLTESGEALDAQDELDIRRALEDIEVKTAMEKCQAEEEANLWRTIGSSSFVDNDLTGDISEDTANRLLDQGICDRTYFGADYCIEWKNRLAEVPVDPLLIHEAVEWGNASQLCPVNVYLPRGCVAKQELWKKYVVKEEWKEPIEGLFEIGRPVEWLPQTTEWPGLAPVLLGLGVPKTVLLTA
jgi:hypothetical protein